MLADVIIDTNNLLVLTEKECKEGKEEYLEIKGVLKGVVKIQR